VEACGVLGCIFTNGDFFLRNFSVSGKHTCWSHFLFYLYYMACWSPGTGAVSNPLWVAHKWPLQLLQASWGLPRLQEHAYCQVPPGIQSLLSPHAWPVHLCGEDALRTMQLAQSESSG
jgi:hypothetical protein